MKLSQAEKKNAELSLVNEKLIKRIKKCIISPFYIQNLNDLKLFSFFYLSYCLNYMKIKNYFISGEKMHPITGLI